VLCGGAEASNTTLVRQALPPAVAGADEVARVAVMTTGAVSLRPASSVTVSSSW
jgi:hypothetical protein